MKEIDPNDYESFYDYAHALRREYMKTSFLLISERHDFKEFAKLGKYLNESSIMKALGCGDKYEMYADAIPCIVNENSTIKTVCVRNFSKAAMKAAYDAEPYDISLQAWTPGIFIFNATEQIDDILDIIERYQKENNIVFSAVTLKDTHWQTGSTQHMGMAGKNKINLDQFSTIRFHP